MSSRRTPDQVLESILETAPRPQKVRALRALHELCRAVYDVGPRDFSRSNIGRLCEERSIMKARSLYTATSSDHCRLIQAWADLAGPMPPKLIDKNKPSEAYVKEITDPVIKMLVLRDLAQLARVTAELNLLKSQTTFVVDRRPVIENLHPTANNAGLNALEAFELAALKKGLAPEVLRKRGWAVTPLGEVVSESGRTIFEPGFSTGLRKLLGEI
jgi:hypothetical protein